MEWSISVWFVVSSKLLYPNCLKYTSKKQTISGVKLSPMKSETNRRKLAWLENEQTCQGNGRIDFNVNVTETANVSEPQFFIVLDDGRCVTKVEWTAGSEKYSKDQVVGIAVRTPLLSFIVSLKQWKERWSEDTDHCITGEHNEAQAMQILSGLEHTRQLVEAQEDEGDTAAKLCWNYNHKELQWYLPSLLELGTICAYKEEINDLLKLVGGDPLLFDKYYWASTEYSSNSAWPVNFGSGHFLNFYKCYSYVVRAVAAFI